MCPDALGAIVLILTGVISEKEALKSIDLKTIFLFGGTLSLAAALQETGAGEQIANKVIGALGSNPSPYVLTLVVFYTVLCDDKLYVQHSDNGTDGPNLSVHRTGHGCRPEGSSDGVCHRRILCIRNTDRYAGKHNGSNRRWL